EITSYPSARRPRAIAAPIPVLPPVTIAVWGGPLIVHSHKKLDIAEGGVAIDQVDALELDPQLAVLDGQVMRGPGRIERLLVHAGLDIMHRRPGDVAVRGQAPRPHLRRLQDVVAAALRLLAERSGALEPLDPDREQQLVLV